MIPFGKLAALAADPGKIPELIVEIAPKATRTLIIARTLQTLSAEAAIGGDLAMTLITRAIMEKRDLTRDELQGLGRSISDMLAMAAHVQAMCRKPAATMNDLKAMVGSHDRALDGVAAAQTAAE